MTTMKVDLIHQVVDTFNKANGQIESISHHLQQPIRKLTHQPFTKMSCTITAASEQGDEVFFTYTASGTHTGEFKGFKPTNKTIQWEGWAVATVTEGKISGLHAVEDDRLKLLKLGIVEIPSMAGKWSTQVLGIQIDLNLKQTRVEVTGTASALGHSFPVAGSNQFPNRPNVALQSQLGPGPGNLLKFSGNFTGTDGKHVEGDYSLGTMSGQATLTRS